MADYISREECIKDLREYEKTAFSGLTVVGCISRIKRIPAADVRPVVRGEWLAYPMLDDMCYQHYSCSICKRVEAIPHGYDVKKELPFCHCGADMREQGAEGGA